MGKKRPRPEEEAAPTPDVVAAAVGAIKAGKMSIRKASQHYGIEKSKLYRIVSGVQKASAQRGRTTAMPKEVEDVLAQKLMLLIENNCYIEMVKLPIVALDICEKLGIRKPMWVAGRKWMSNFFKRHPELSPLKSGKLTHSFTSESFAAKAAAAKAALLAAEEAHKVAKAAATAAKKVADAAVAAAAAAAKIVTDAQKLAKKKAEEQAKLDRATVKAAKAAAATAKLAAKGAPKAKVPPSGGAGKRGRDDGGDLWRPQIKRIRA